MNIPRKNFNLSTQIVVPLFFYNPYLDLRYFKMSETKKKGKKTGFFIILPVFNIKLINNICADYFWIIRI